jgi:general secretion pathway protein F
LPAFRFEAVDTSGKPQRGLVDAESAPGSRSRAEGLFPTIIEAPMRRTRARGASSGAVERPRLPAAQVVLSTRQLATLVRPACRSIKP